MTNDKFSLASALRNLTDAAVATTDYLHALGLEGPVTVRLETALRAAQRQVFGDTESPQPQRKLTQRSSPAFASPNQGNTSNL